MVSKFQPLSTFQQPLIDGYQLLPFRFTSLDDHDYVLTNQAGEFIILERTTLEVLVRHQLPASGWLYDDLKSKHFIIDSDSSVAMDLLPHESRMLAEMGDKTFRIGNVHRDEILLDVNPSLHFAEGTCRSLDGSLKSCGTMMRCAASL